MNGFDVEIITYVNQYSQQSWILDNLIHLFVYNNLLKGGVLVTLVWWLWFKTDERQLHYREHIIAILISCLVATALARILALSLPFRLRPVHEEDLNFVIPHGLDPTALDGWSSFPSDHAVLFFGLSAGILFISRKIGIFALIYTALFISLPRIYVGVHYLTDIVVGAIIGIIIVLLGNRYFTKSRNIQLISNCSYSRPDIFYPLFFLLTYQIIDLFSGSRAILKTGVKSILNIFGFTT